MYRNRIDIPTVTKNILIINLIIFVATLINENFIVRVFALFYPTSPYFHWWQPITHMFVHGGFLHIFFNMYALFIFGSVVEQIIGSKKFLTFYLICGLGAAALHLGVEYFQAQAYMAQIAENSQSAIAAYSRLKMTPTVGASGAIYGILIGYAMLFPQARLTLIFPPITLTAKWWVIIFVGIELITGITGTADGVAHFAHLGGMLVGWLMIILWKKRGILFDKEKWI